MLYSLFIIDHGICLYIHHFKLNVAIDEQLVSGFLTAIGTFAQETFKTGLQAVQIRNGEKMSFFIEKSHDLLFCAISDDRDNNKLLEKILSMISKAFVDQMGDRLKSAARSDVTYYKAFDENISALLKRKDKKRNVGTMIQGVALGALFFIGTLFLFGILLRIIGVNITFVTYYLSLALFLSSAISGYFAGNTRMGGWNGVLFFVLFVVSMFLIPGLETIGVLLLVIAPFVLLVCIAGGVWGGMKCDQSRLYPLPKITSEPENTS